MNLINKINEYIDNGRIVFLSGAGCSKDSPSNLPLGNQVIQDLVDFSCIEGEKKDLKEQLHRKLRFEHFMQLFTNYIDPEINALNFFTQCHSPNFQHCFLAEAIKKRNYVMTTNFDNLIEYALQNQGIPKENIYPLIFKKDYSSFNEASEVPQERNYPIIKLHGSITNFRNKNSTKESLIFNIETLGKEKNLSNLRTLKSYKVDFLRKILKNHYLVVLGYSGADDFDIIPTLKRLRNFKGIIWLKHNSIQNEVKIQEIKCSNKSQKPIPDPIYKFLYDLKDFNNECEIFIIEGQTSLVLKQIKKVKFLQKPNKFNLDFKNWVQDNIKKPNILQSQFLTEKIYLDLNLFNKAKKNIKKLYSLAKSYKNRFWIWKSLMNYAKLFSHRNLSKTKNIYEYALKIANGLEEVSIIETERNLADTYAGLEIRRKARMLYNQVENYFKKHKKDRKLYHLYHNKIHFFLDIKDYKNAEKYLDKTKSYFEKIDNLIEKAYLLEAYACLEFHKGNFWSAKDCLNQSREIFHEFGMISRDGMASMQVGYIDFKNRDLYSCIDNLTKAYDFFFESKDVIGLATASYNFYVLYSLINLKKEAKMYLNDTIYLIKKFDLVNTKYGTNIFDLLKKLKNFYNPSYFFSDDLYPKSMNSLRLNWINLYYQNKKKNEKIIDLSKMNRFKKF